MPLYSLKLKLGHPNLKFTHVLNLAYSRAIFLRRQWQLTPVLLPGKSHGQRSLVGGSPWGCEESDTTEWLPFHFSLSCIGEGNGNPLQCSCLENPRDGRAGWAAVYGVAQSQTRLKWPSSSSSSTPLFTHYVGDQLPYLWLDTIPGPNFMHLIHKISDKTLWCKLIPVKFQHQLLCKSLYPIKATFSIISYTISLGKTI